MTDSKNAGKNRITRGRFIRKAGIAGGAVAAAGLGLSGKARAQAVCPPQVVSDGAGGFSVIPTGDVKLDCSNVQCAVDAAAPGATILLKASPTYFNFGTVYSPQTPGQVFLKKDVIIKGELGTVQLPGKVADRTAIYGGGSGGKGDENGVLNNKTVIMGLPPFDFTVSGIWFDHNRAVSIRAESCISQLNITDNVGKDYIPEAVILETHGGIMGLFFGGSREPPPDAFRGKITIENNLVEYSPPPRSEGNLALFMNDMPELGMLTVRNNRFRIDRGWLCQIGAIPNMRIENNVFGPLHEGGATFLGLGVWNYHLIGAEMKSVTIRNNLIAGTEGFGIRVEGGLGPIVIANNQVLNGLFAEGAINVSMSDNVTISGNEIAGGSAGEPSLLGIMAHGVWMESDAPEGWSEYVSHNNVVSGNTVSGNFWICMTSGNSGSCTFSGNDLSKTNSSLSQLMLSWGALNNTFSNNLYGTSSLTGILAGFEPAYMGDDALPYFPGEQIVANNSFTNETFPGIQYYPGWMPPYFDAYGNLVGLGCVLLTESTRGNKVNSLNNGGILGGLDICRQVLDFTDNWETQAYDGLNVLPGYVSCTQPNMGFRAALQQKLAGKMAELKAKQAEAKKKMDAFRKF